MKRSALVLSAFIVLGFGCGTGDEGCINCPGHSYGPTSFPTLENIWPNKDGTEWVYNHEERTWEGNWVLYPTPAAVPPLPSWSWISAAVEARKPIEPFESQEGFYTIKFAGMITTTTGVLAQNLTEELLLVSPPLTPGEKQAAIDRSAIVASRENVLRSFGALDLIARMKTGATVWGPTFLHGGAWEKTFDYIGTYGNSSQRLEWKFLARDLRVGSGFSYQINPTDGGNIVLQCRVFGMRTFETSARRIEKALDCLYILDYGVVAVSTPDGKTLGYTRLIHYGQVIYAPMIGPVYCYERYWVETGYPPSRGWGDLTERLNSTNVTDAWR